jgi:hypothetical protein
MFGAIAVTAALAGMASADGIFSDFNTDAEGWIVADGDAPDNQSTTALPNYQSSGGNEAGFITTPFPWPTTAFFVAPDKFLGDQSGFFGGRIEVDRRFVEPRVSTDPYQIDYAADLTMTGADMTLAVDLVEVPIDHWDSYTIDLSASGGWFHLDTGVAATDDEISALLGDLEDIRVRGNLNDVFGNLAIDNFGLVPTPGSVAVLGAAALMIRRRRN